MSSTKKCLSCNILHDDYAHMRTTANTLPVL
jgi:hypothetical protein